MGSKDSAGSQLADARQADAGQCLMKVGPCGADARRGSLVAGAKSAAGGHSDHRQPPSRRRSLGTGSTDDAVVDSPVYGPAGQAAVRCCASADRGRTRQRSSATRATARRRSAPGSADGASLTRSPSGPTRSATASTRQPRRPAPSFRPQIYKRRYVVERCFNRLKQWHGIATRYDKTADSYQAAVTLASLLMWA